MRGLVLGLLIFATMIISAFAAESSLPITHTKMLPQTATRGIDFTRPLLTLDGKPITNPDKTPVTIGGVAASCLVQEKESPGEGPALWALAVRIANAKDATLDAAEVHAIETCLADKPALVSGQIIPLIDPNYKPAPLR